MPTDHGAAARFAGGSPPAAEGWDDDRAPAGKGAGAIAGRGALAGLRVLDAASLFAGPLAATLLGDHGAEVLKIEHPRGDALRGLGWSKHGVSLWWQVVNRNKRGITLKLSDERGAAVLKQLLRNADVLVESFRPGTLERWGLDPAALIAANPGLVVLRTSGFGQTGPYAPRPGFGTLAEAMSGFAHVNGYPDGPPTLPPFALADGLAGITGAFGVMSALWNRQHGGGGQVVDLAIYEPLYWVLGAQTTLYDQLGEVQGRSGNRAPFTAPRNTYCTKDEIWLALSGSSQSTAERALRAVGREDLVAAPWFASHAGRLAHADDLDAAIGGWIGERTAAEVQRVFEEFEAAITPVLDAREIAEDPQYLAREMITTMHHPLLGEVAMQNIVPRLEGTPGRIERRAPELGEHNHEVLVGELGVGEGQLDELVQAGVIAPAGNA